MAETIESRRRSRVVRIGSTLAILVATALVAWGFSRANDDRSPDSSTPPTIGAIQAPAEVNSTQPDVVSGSPVATNDVPTIPTGTADVALPPVSTDIATP